MILAKRKHVGICVSIRYPRANICSSREAVGGAFFFLLPSDLRARKNIGAFRSSFPPNVASVLLRNVYRLTPKIYAVFFLFPHLLTPPYRWSFSSGTEGGSCNSWSHVASRHRRLFAFLCLHCVVVLLYRIGRATSAVATLFSQMGS